MTSNMYVIHFEDLDWIFEARHKLGKEDHTWLMTSWLRDHDVSALMSLMCIGYYLRYHEAALLQVKDYIKTQRNKELQHNTIKGETDNGKKQD